MADMLADYTATSTSSSCSAAIPALGVPPPHDEPTAISCPSQVASDLPDAIGVSLSGGGVRAALFSLGVLMYLVRSGLNRRVRIVTSVSGGSITNAALAASGDFSNMSEEDFDPVCHALAQRMAKQGSFFLPNTPLLFKLFVMFVTIPIVELVVLEWTDHMRNGAYLVARVFILLGELVVVFMLTIIAELLFRQSFQRDVYRRLIDSVRTDTASRWLGSRSIELSDLANTTVNHILCATELHSGQPMFFSNRWVYSETFGWAEPRISADRAVYASTAFPGGFTPMRIRTARLEMVGGTSTTVRPRAFVLADGGIFNNLGDDWFRIASELRVGLRQDRRFQLPESTDYKIIVNASSPPRVKEIPRIPIVHKCLLFARVITVLYENTVRPRLMALDIAPMTTVIDISKSPVDVAKRSQRTARSPSERDRADALVVQLEALGSDYWVNMVGDTSLLKTTLRSVGREHAAHLMRHGYLSAMAALHARFDTPGIDQAPDDHTFAELTEDRRAKRLRRMAGLR